MRIGITGYPTDGGSGVESHSSWPKQPWRPAGTMSTLMPDSASLITA